MAASVAANARHNTNYRLSAAQHYGMVVETGVYTPGALGTYTSVGDPITFASGITPLAVFFSFPMTSGLSTAGYQYLYDPDNATVRYLGVGIELTTTCAMSALTANYVAIGWK